MSQSQVWHPFTQHALEPTIPEIIRTEGAYLHKADGTRILDAISSWWVVTHGHRHPCIIKAIETTASSLDQIIFAGFTHEPGRTPRQGTCRPRYPSGLDWVFYSDSGSTAVEVALKMALGYFRNIGAPRSRIVVMEHSYHGDTIGTMSVGARGVFNAAYEPLLFEVDTIPFPATGREQETLDRFEAVTRDRCAAALIVEPLVLGAGGMLMYPAWVLTELKKIAETSGTLLIADEVMTGWGRTGTMFACEQASISPDILCTSKGPDRRRDPPGGHACHRCHLPGPLLRGPEEDLLSFEFLHRQSDCLRGGTRQCRDLA
ncbi:aminotransferase class III-fold pyridoxal phosphate-dependent enzyme [Mesorhizobium calcicola]|uniref:Aminotransferase class III-fold pyridoxal phosphate-dependent enzyme n=1 Tax=Mesorhizobium calcicola TaxID=1300310 RepID=A0ABW4W8B0_9HYPH